MTNGLTQAKPPGETACATDTLRVCEVRPVRPVLMAFRDDFALPSSERGPVLCWELARSVLLLDINLDAP